MDFLKLRIRAVDECWPLDLDQTIYIFLSSRRDIIINYNDTNDYFTTVFMRYEFIP